MKTKYHIQINFSFLIICFSTLSANFSIAQTSSKISVAYDNVCGAFPLIYGANGPFNTVGATVEIGEPAPPGGDCGSQIAWCDGTISNTLWFSFVAPPSGRIQIQSPDFDTQLALWDAASCASILSGAATLIAANDDDGNALADEGVIYSSFLNPVNCLTPGKTYYVQLDPYTSPGGNTQIILNDIGFADPTFTGLNATYCLTDTASTLVPVMTGGTFSGAGLSGNIFTPSLAGTGTHAIVYKLSNCDSMIQTVIVNDVPNAAYSYSNVSNVYSFTNTSTSATTTTWDFGDLSPTSTLPNPTHTFTSNGVYNVQLIITNSCGTDTIVHQIIIIGIAGIEEFSLQNVSVYPNPANDIFNISITNANFSEVKITLCDIQGKEIYNETNNNNSVNYKKQISVIGMAKGIYYLKLSTTKGIKVQKLVVE
jgi:PKD repeat protein